MIKSGMIKKDIDGHGYQREITIVKHDNKKYRTAYWILCEDFLTASVRITEQGEYFIIGAGSKKYQEQIKQIIDIFNKQCLIRIK